MKNTLFSGKNNRLKIIGISILGVPLAFLMLFLFGELFSGDVSGLGHIVQILPLVLLIFLSWTYPRLGGWFLVIGGITLGILYTKNNFPLSTILFVETLLFLPPVVAGTLFIISTKYR